MKLSEAILQGCQRSAPLTGLLVSRDANGALSACVLGAAYLARMPDVPASETLSVEAVEAFYPVLRQRGFFKRLPKGWRELLVTAFERDELPRLLAVDQLRLGYILTTLSDQGVPREALAGWLAEKGQ